MAGLLITFEGIDGCGKSTQIGLLAEWLNERGYQVNLYREPGGTGLSEAVRELLLHKSIDIDPVTELLLFSAARSQLVREKVIPSLEQGTVVLLDRFYDSTTAYQGYGRGSATPEEIERLNRLASHQRAPDLTFYLKITPETGLERRAGVDTDRIERAGTDFYERVKKGFDELSSREGRFVTLDGSQSVTVIQNQIREETHSRLKKS